MTKTLQKAAALLLTALLLLGLFSAVPVSAAQEQPFVLKVASNFLRLGGRKRRRVYHCLL